MTRTHPRAPLRILNAEPLGYSDEARAILRDLGEVVEAALPRRQLLAAIADYEVLIVRLGHQVDRAVLDAGRRLVAVVSATTGLDHIDVDYARSRGIAVLSLQGEVEFLSTISAAAEHAWALLLALVRRLPASVSHVRDGGWDRDAFRGHELAGKRLGIVGLGRLGRKVARYGLAFEMEVAAYDPHATDWPEGVARTQTLEDLLRRSDVLSLHAPLNESTAGMIGAAELALLPEGAVLINTARGRLVKETALAQALDGGHLAGAAVDVLAEERDPAQRARSPLLAYARTYDNLLITPHIGGATYESMAKTEVFMARKLADHLKGLGAGPRAVPSASRSHA